MTTPDDDPKGVGTTGHDWDGIRELNNPLPRWWLWTLYATIIWGIGYCIAYPAWPLLDRATAGLLGYATRADVARQIAEVDARNADVTAALAAADLQTLTPDDPVYHFGVAGGAAVFRAHCSQCHGAGAAGAPGYPNLLDDAWLWGGSVTEIAQTVRHGIRNETDPDARWSQMPAFGDVLSRDEVQSTTEFVLSLSGSEHDADLAAIGAPVFADNCAACHGDAGLGDDAIGAPNLADALWLYDGTRDGIATSITEARFGVMPPWGNRLTEDEIKAVALYVHQLGGGE